MIKVHLYFFNALLDLEFHEQKIVILMKDFIITNLSIPFTVKVRIESIILSSSNIFEYFLTNKIKVNTPVLLEFSNNTLKKVNKTKH